MTRIRTLFSAMLISFLTVACGGGGYTINGDIIDLDEGDISLLDAFGSTIGTAVVKDGKFTFKGKGYYTFTFENYDLATDIGNGWDMTIYDEDMNELLSFSNIKQSVTSRRIAFEEGTVFYIIVRDYSTYTTYRTNEAVYGLTAEFTEDKIWESERNDTTVAANTIVGDKIYGTILDGDDSDYFKYTAKATGYIEVYAENTLGDVDNVNYGWVLHAYDKSANELDSNEFTTVSERFYKTVKKGETVYFKINPKATYYTYVPIDVQYTLNVKLTKNANIESEKNDNVDTANTIKKSVVGVIGDLTSEQEDDYFKFTATKSGKIKIKVDVGDLGDYPIEVKVYDSNKKELKSKPQEISSSKTVTFKAVKGKKYYLKLTNKNNYKYYYNVFYKLTIK